MKKLGLLIVMLFLFIPSINADGKITVGFSKCVDGDTARFIIDDEEKSVRFLAIDTPESTTTIEEYGPEAAEFTCNKLTNASKIEIEYDPNSDEFDKYDRVLAWVYVDGKLLQELIIEEGLGEVTYLYGDYLYTATLQIKETAAKLNKVGMWSDSTINYWYIAGIIIVFILIFIFSAKYRKKIVKKGKSALEKELKKRLKL